MKRLTTLALLAGMLSAPALHSEEPGSGAAAPLSFPQLNDAADSEPGDEPPAASPEEGASPAAPAPATAGDAAATAPVPVMPDLPPPVSGTAAPEVIPVAPVWGGDLNLAQMGMPDGIILSGGQRQSGVSFTLPADQVVIHSQLSLAVRVSPEMASRNATLQLMLNGQPLGTLPLGADGEDVSHYQLDIPPALMVSSNNLSVKINDGDTLQCQRDIHDTSRVTVLPTSHFSWESQQLNISDDLSHFPRPFFDSLLSYVGLKDAYSGKTWGQVTKNGGTLQLSYDDGDAGFYVGGGGYSYLGQNVASNTSINANAGVYLRPYHDEYRQLQAGLSMSYMDYSKNLSYFTYGQGGYFSPQNYVSVSLPVSLTEKYDNWTMKLGGSVGYQSYSQDKSAYFPTNSEWQQTLETAVSNGFAKEAYYSATSKSGIGYTLRAGADYKVNKQMTLGGQIGYDTFGDYNESTAGLYIRYMLGDH